MSPTSRQTERWEMFHKSPRLLKYDHTTTKTKESPCLYLPIPGTPSNNPVNTTVALPASLKLALFLTPGCHEETVVKQCFIYQFSFYVPLLVFLLGYVWQDKLVRLQSISLCMCVMYCCNETICAVYQYIVCQLMVTLNFTAPVSFQGAKRTVSVVDFCRMGDVSIFDHNLYYMTQFCLCAFLSFCNMFCEFLKVKNIQHIMYILYIFYGSPKIVSHYQIIKLTINHNI